MSYVRSFFTFCCDPTLTDLGIFLCFIFLCCYYLYIPLDDLITGYQRVFCLYFCHYIFCLIYIYILSSFVLCFLLRSYCDRLQYVPLFYFPLLLYLQFPSKSFRPVVRGTSVYIFSVIQYTSSKVITSYCILMICLSLTVFLMVF